MGKERIEKKTVEHAAKLSRLSFSEKEIEKFSEELGIIVDYINKLKEVNTDDVAAMSHAIKSVKNVFREDRVKASLDKEDALKNASKKNDNLFIVPKIIE